MAVSKTDDYSWGAFLVVAFCLKGEAWWILASMSLSWESG
jgi:hypothetical protein